MNTLQEISKNIQKGNSANIQSLIKKALKENIAPLEIINNGLLNGIGEVSVLFKNNEIYIPEVLVAASAMNIGTEILRPLLTNGENKSIATVIIGTVKGDLHDIGKNLVGVMLEGAGFNVVDIGVDALPEKFLISAKEHSAQLVAISALLTTTMQMMKITVATLQNSELKNQIKILIGGAPVTAHFARLINADGFAEDAATAVDVAKQILKLDTI